MNLKIRNPRKLVLTVGILAILIVVAIGYNLSFAYVQSNQSTIEAGSMAQPASYTIFRDQAGTVYARNGTTGSVDFSGSDARTVINNCFDVLNAGEGGEVYLKEGDYTITGGSIIMYNNTKLSGQNYGSELQASMGNPIILLNGKERISITNVILSNNKATASSRCITIIDCVRVELTDVWCYGGEIGFEIGGTVLDVSTDLVHCQATDGKEGVVITGKLDQIRIIDSRIFAQDTNGIRVDTTTGGIVHIFNCNIQNPDATRSIIIYEANNLGCQIVAGGIYGGEVQGIYVSQSDCFMKISDFTIMYPEQSAIHIYDTDDVMINNIMVFDASDTNPDTYAGIKLEDTLRTMISNIRVNGTATSYSIEEVGTTDYTLYLDIFAEEYIKVIGANSKLGFCWNGTTFLWTAP